MNEHNINKHINNNNTSNIYAIFATTIKHNINTWANYVATHERRTHSNNIFKYCKQFHSKNSSRWRVVITSDHELPMGACGADVLQPWVAALGGSGI